MITPILLVLTLSGTPPSGATVRGHEPPLAYNCANSAGGTGLFIGLGAGSAAATTYVAISLATTNSLDQLPNAWPFILGVGAVGGLIGLGVGGFYGAETTYDCKSPPGLGGAGIGGAVGALGGGALGYFAGASLSRDDVLSALVCAGVVGVCGAGVVGGAGLAIGGFFAPPVHKDVERAEPDAQSGPPDPMAF